MMKDVVAGIDIGGTNIIFGLVDKSGNVISEDRLKTVEYPDIKDYISAQHEALAKMVGEHPGHRLTGLGVGAPNANYHKGTIELAPNLAWKGIVPLGRFLKEKVQVPVVVTNDANAAAMGEMIFGGAKGMKDFIVLTLGTGLGSGIVVNGEVVYGHTGFAGELGHTTIVPGGRECGCGRRGCFENYASASGLVRTVINLLSEMRAESELRFLTPAELTSKKIVEEAQKGDKIALAAINYTAEMLALGIINAITFSSPEAVFLFGGLVKSGELLLAPVRAYVDQNVMPIFRGSVKILPSGVSETNAAVLGAAALAWNEMKK
jgi:glucokinase